MAFTLQIMYIINKKYLSNAGKIKYKYWCEKQIST